MKDEDRLGKDGKMKHFMKLDSNEPVGRIGPPDSSWLKGTIQEVRAWLKKETHE